MVFVFHSNIKSKRKKIMAHTCKVCGGSGQKICTRCGGYGTFNSGEICPICQGSGKVECNVCNGTGKVDD